MLLKTITVMDTLKGELLKVVTTKVVNKALSSSPIQNHQYLISNDLVVMGPHISILVNSVLSLCILFQGLKMYLVSKYTFAKNA